MGKNLQDIVKIQIKIYLHYFRVPVWLGNIDRNRDMMSII